MKIKSLGILTMSAVLLGACGNNSNSSDTKSENTNKQDKDTTVIALNDIKTSPEDAIKKAQSVYKGQNLKGISYEKTNGEWSYKIEQQKPGEESEVIVSDKNKKVLHKETEKEDSINKNDEFKYEDAIDYKKAIKKGQKEFDGDIKEWSLSEDNGELVYDMDLKKGNTKHEITVEAKNGKVLSNETDN